MHALSRWLLMMLFLSCFGCASGELGVIVSVQGWPVEALSMRVRTSLDGAPRDVLQIPSGQNRFVVRLAPGETGQLSLDATALDRGGCKVATGQLTLGFGLALHPTQEATLRLNRLTNILCTLTVDFTEGTGAVVSDPAGILGESTGVREFDFISGTPVQLIASFDEKQKYVIWHGDCTGSGGCSLTMDSSRRVEVAFPPRICTPTGFCWQNPLPQGSDLSRVWVDPDGVAWAIGDAGTILRCQGKSCTALDSGTPENLYAIFGRSAQEVWAAGYYGTVVKCSPSACTVVSTRTVNQTPLLGVWVSDSGEVWAVGYTGLVFKCDTSACAKISSGTTDRLPRVWGSARGEVWTAGDGGTVLRCSGTTCTKIPSGTSRDLYDVWVSGDGTAWVVGDGGTILQCRGSGCSPLASGRSDLFLGVVGNSAGEVFVHGVSGTLLRCVDSTCAPLATGTSSEIYAVFASPAGEVWAAGSNGDVVKCRGDTCVLLSSGTQRALRSISGGPAGEVWAVGSSGTLVRCTGESCLTLSSGSLFELYSVFGSATGDIWVGGQALIRCSRGSCLPVPRKTETRILIIRGTSAETWAVGEQGTIIRCNTFGCDDLSGGIGSTYVDLAPYSLGGALVVGDSLSSCSSTSCDLRLGVAGVESAEAVVGNRNEVWLGGSMGVLVKIDRRAGQAQVIPSGTTDRLTGMWMSSSGEVWAVGRRSMIRCSGTSCTSLPWVAADDLTWVGGTKSGEAWAVGKAGTVVKCSGTGCTLIPSVTALNLRRVAADSSETIWTTNGSGSVIRCSGMACTRILVHADLQLTDVWVSSTGEAWVTSFGGSILRYTP